MNILALEPYFGGSHRAFLEGWKLRSRHQWTILTLEPRKWKWRMRHSAVTFADRIREALQKREAALSWDMLLCSDMLNLAEFRGMAPKAVRDLPSVVYFHENQLTYPVRQESERDYHFGYTNMTSALSAKSAWFNSEFNRTSFLEALPSFLKRMPDNRPSDIVERIRSRSAVHPPGVEAFPPRDARRAGPIRILWAARWEHDKNPETFFEAIQLLIGRGVPLRLSVIGEQFREGPAVFTEMERELAPYTDHWGFVPTKAAYWEVLSRADVFVSTADHEFFGISAVEAILAGAFPLLPERLSYPELLGGLDSDTAALFLYSGGAAELGQRLEKLIGVMTDEGDLHAAAAPARRDTERFLWDRRAPELDNALEGVARPSA